MIVTALYPNQDEKSLKSFLDSINEPKIVFSQTPISWVQNIVFQGSNWPPSDDFLNVFYSFIISNPVPKDIEFTIIDWQSLSFSDFEKEIKKLKKLKDFNVQTVIENIRIQDFRLPPYMENLLKICYDLKLSGTDRLFKENPFLIMPKVIKGKSDELEKVLKSFITVRSSISSPKFIGITPIFNSEFSIDESR